MSDIIRQARAMYGPAFDAMMQDAGQIKTEYVAGGGDPADVYSPERVQAYADGGPAALEGEPMQTREDGSIAGPYVPTEMALANNMVQRQAIPAVLAALTDGVQTVSSGVRDGVGFAIGRAPDGSIVRVER